MPDAAATDLSESPRPDGSRGAEIGILVSCPLWVPHICEGSVRRAAECAVSTNRRAAAAGQFAGAELAIDLADDCRIAALNAQFRGKPAATNVLAFPAFEARDLERVLAQARSPERPLPLGDVIVAFETVRQEAVAQGKSLEHHLAHLVIHGVLHCLGHDHRDRHEAARMEALERHCLAQLGIDDPYRSPGMISGNGT